MSLHTRVSGAWKTVSAVSVKVSGAWKTCRQVYVKQGGVWKKCLQNTSTVTVNGPGGLNQSQTLSNVASGTTIKVTGTFSAPPAHYYDSITYNPRLTVVFDGCSDYRGDKNYSGNQTANFSFTTTAKRSNPVITIRSSFTDSIQYTDQGSLSNVKIRYTRSGYFD